MIFINRNLNVTIISKMHLPDNSAFIYLAVKKKLVILIGGKKSEISTAVIAKVKC
jgi:hypothetical protein